MRKATHYYPRGPIKGWSYEGNDAAFMVPSCEWFTTEEASEYLEECPGDDEPREAGWYSRLTAPGYLDCTDWSGPFPTAFRAIRELCRLYDCDLTGKSVGISP